MARDTAAAVELTTGHGFERMLKVTVLDESETGFEVDKEVPVHRAVWE